ncbi:MAG: PspC domain-containing protein [Candidatus Fimenecus sp.]
MFKEKKLYKSTNKMIDGVCAGIAEFFEIDPTIVRVLYAVLALCTAGFGGTILYIVLAIIMPRRPFPDYQYNEFQDGPQQGE